VLEPEAVPVPAEEAGFTGGPEAPGDDEPSVRRHYIRFRR
jgi:hypothetical protein